MNFAAEWCTNDEVVILRCVSASFFVVVNEWQFKGIVDAIDELKWEEMSDTIPSTNRRIQFRHSSKKKLQG